MLAVQATGTIVVPQPQVQLQVSDACRACVMRVCDCVSECWLDRVSVRGRCECTERYECMGGIGIQVCEWYRCYACVSLWVCEPVYRAIRVECMGGIGIQMLRVALLVHVCVYGSV